MWLTNGTACAVTSPKPFLGDTWLESPRDGEFGLPLAPIVRVIHAKT